MLHPLNVVACEAEMMQLVQFQRGLLELAIARAAKQSNNQSTFQQVMGVERGSWFWSRYNGGETWKKHFDSLVDVCEQSNDTHLVLDTFDHDIDFHNHLSDNFWIFEYSKLDNKLQDAIKALFEYCYTYLKTGYDNKVHGTSGVKITRNYFLINYISTNKSIEVCPVCDARLEFKDLGQTDKEGIEIPILTLDHLFPKAHYPFLSLHPYNLVPTCHICNTIFKGEKDPLTHAPSSAICHTFHSYKDRSIQILNKIEVFRSPPSGEVKVCINDPLNLSQYRIQNLNHVVNLPKRWNDNIQRLIIEPLIIILSHQSDGNNSRNQSDLLRDLKKERELCQVRKQSDHTLRIAYLEYALSNPREQKFLLERYIGNR
jgi:hypothetical protein